MGRFGGTSERRPSGACVRRAGARSLLAVRRVRSGAIRTRADRPEGWATGTVGVNTIGRAGTAGPRKPCGRRSAGSGSGFTVVQPVTLSRTRSKKVSGRRGTGPLCATSGCRRAVPRGRSPQGRTGSSDADAAHPVIRAPKGGTSEAVRSGRGRWRRTEWRHRPAPSRATSTSTATTSGGRRALWRRQSSAALAAYRVRLWSEMRSRWRAGCHPSVLGVVAAHSTVSQT